MFGYIPKIKCALLCSSLALVGIGAACAQDMDCSMFHGVTQGQCIATNRYMSLSPHQKEVYDATKRIALEYESAHRVSLAPTRQNVLSIAQQIGASREDLPIIHEVVTGVQGVNQVIKQGDDFFSTLERCGYNADCAANALQGR
jgi:hypothetical protein